MVQRHIVKQLQCVLVGALKNEVCFDKLKVAEYFNDYIASIVLSESEWDTS